MNLGSVCSILQIQKGKARDIRPTPDDEQLNAFQHQPFTIRGSGRLFLCSEDRVAQSNESNDEDTKLNQISVCNVHRHPSFLSSGGLSLRRG